MENLPVKKEVKKTLIDLYSAKDLELTFNKEIFNSILSTEPNKKWMVENQYIKIKGKPMKYLPIDKVQFLWKKIFKSFEPEIISYCQLFNAVSVHARIHYTDPTDGVRRFTDGAGAVAIQLKAGSNASDLSAINHDSVMKAFPAAYSYALKNAAKKLGRIFGDEINDDSPMIYEVDTRVMDKMAELQEKQLNEKNQ